MPVKFEIFDDRLEITSAGGIPDGLSQDEFFEGYSVPRNKELMRIYKDVELVEQLGSGIPRILAAYDKRCFTFSDNFLRMSFPTSHVGIIGGTKGGIIGGTKGGIIDELTERQQEVLALIKANPKTSITKIAEALRVNRSAAQDHVDALKDKGIIDREGGTRGYWKILISH